MKDIITSAVLVFLFGIGGSFILGLSGVVYSYEQLTSNAIVLSTQLQVDDGLYVGTGTSTPTNSLKYIRNLKNNQDIGLSQEIKGNIPNADEVNVRKVATKNGHYYEFLLTQKVPFIMGINIDINKYGMSSLVFNETRVKDGYEVGLPVVEKVTIKRVIGSGEQMSPIEREKNTALGVDDLGIPADRNDGTHFEGWYLDAGFKNKFKNMTSLSTDLTVYAKFEINSYEIVRNLNGGTLNTSSLITKANYGTILDYAKLGAPTKSGYDFGGWYADEALTNRIPNSGVQIQNNQVFYASWIPKKYVVTKHMNNDTNQILTTNYDYGTILSGDDFGTSSKKGYTFNGWYTDANLTKKYTSAALTGSIDVYARLDANEYILTLNAGEGQILGDSIKTVTYDGKIGALPVPTREGYSFDGWYTGQNGTGTKINENMIYTTIGDSTIYANYKVEQMNLAILDRATGEVIAKHEFDFGQKINLKDYVIKKDGYIFKGFFTKENDGTFLQVGDENFNYELDIRDNTEIYANLIKDSFTITLHNLQPNDKTKTEKIENIKKTQKVNLKTLTDVNGIYDFVGWAKTEDGSPIDNPYTYNYEEDTDLYAVWVNNSKVIQRITEYNETTGEIYKQMTDINKKAGQTLDINELGTPTRKGYTFTGWKLGVISKENKLEFSDYTTGEVEYGMSFYAQWEANTYNYIIHYLDGTTSTKSAKYDSMVTLADDTTPGYTFKGYYTKANGLGNKFETTFKFEYDYAIDIYAFGTLNSYNITYNLKGGTFATTPVSTYKTNETFTLPIPTRDGYSFGGWYTNNALTTAQGTTIPKGSYGDKELFAKWISNEYTVSFNPMDGTAVQPIKVKYNEAYGTLPTTTKTGYTFDGWYTSSVAGTKVLPTTVYTTMGNKTLYAKWIANTNTKYVINHYQMNLDGTTYTKLESENKTGTTASKLTLDSLAKTYTGFTYENAKVGGIVSTETTILADGSRVIDIYYSRNKYTFDINATVDGTSVTSNIPAKFDVVINGTTVATQVTDFYKQGEFYYGSTYSIKNIKPNTGKKLAFSDGKTEITGTVTDVTSNYILIQSIKYTVKYDANGGVGTMAPTEVTYDVHTNLTKNTFTRKGYTFSGWNLRRESDGKFLYSSSTASDTWFAEGTETAGYKKSLLQDGYETWHMFSTDKAIGTVLAVWTPNIYTVSFNSDGGSTATSINVKYDGTYGTLPTPTKAGYVFAGWLDSNNNKVTSTTKYTTLGNSTLKASWTAASYTVTFNANGGSTPTANKKVTYKTAYGTLPTPTRSGYKFLGWFTSATGGSQVLSTNTYTSTTNSTLYAHWEATKTYIMGKGSSAPIAAGYNYKGMGSFSTGSNFTYTKTHDNTTNTDTFVGKTYFDNVNYQSYDPALKINATSGKTLVFENYSTKAQTFTIYYFIPASGMFGYSLSSQQITVTARTNTSTPGTTNFTLPTLYENNFYIVLPYDTSYTLYNIAISYK